MFAELTKAVREFLKLAPRFLAALATAALLLLFLPNVQLIRLGLTEFVQKWRFGIGLTLVVSVALLSAHLTVGVGGTIKRSWNRRKIRQHIIDRLHNLTEDEKQILRYYLANDTRANVLRVDDGVVQELVVERIIYRSASLGNVVEGFAHNISDTAWDYLHRHPELLHGTTVPYRSDKRMNWMG